MKATPKVSIILPTYNGEKFLKDSILSCLTQTYTNIELIVVDDCSKDSTPEIVRSFFDPRLKYIRNQVNQRLPRSLNIGFKAATGDYLTWTSDDNAFLPHAIEELIGFLQNHPDVGFVYTDLIVRYLETGEQQLRRFSDINLEKENNIGACYLYTRKVYETVGDYDPRFEWVEDYDYWIRIAKKFQVRHYPKALYIYGDHVQSLTSTRRYPIVMMRDILRYWHGYLTLAEFTETIRQFSVDIQTHVSGREAQVNAWRQVFGKAFGISYAFGIKFAALVLFLFLRKILNLLAKPFVKIFAKPLERLRWRRVESRLSVTPGRKNILVMIPSLVVGGSEKVGWDLIKGLTSDGFDFHLITNKKENNVWCKNFCAAHKNVVLLDEFAADAEYRTYLPALIRRLKIDLLLNNNATVAYRCAADLKKEFPQLKMLDLIHLEHVGGGIEKYAWAAQHMDRRVCISHHLKEYMMATYRRENIAEDYDEKLTVIHNGIAPINTSQVEAERTFRRRYRINPTAKIVTFIGRLAPEKKPFLFIEIARTLLAKDPQTSWTFVMAGDGPFLAKVKTRIKECGLEDHFILTGMLPDVGELLTETFVLLVVSQHEGIPLVIQEAFARQVPVISTRVGAIDELIEEGINGYLIEIDEKTVDRFAQQISRLAAQLDLYAQLKSGCGRMFPEFSLDHMIARYRRLLSELCTKST